jgi:hypothetical protein
LPDPAAKEVEVVKERDAVPEVPTEVLRDTETTDTVPTAGILT